MEDVGRRNWWCPAGFSRMARLTEGGDIDYQVVALSVPF